jgi:hypothetical protein
VRDGPTRENASEVVSLVAHDCVRGQRRLVHGRRGNSLRFVFEACRTPQRYARHGNGPDYSDEVVWTDCPTESDRTHHAIDDRRIAKGNSSMARCMVE